MSQEQPESGYEFSPEEKKIIASFEAEGVFGPATLHFFSEWDRKSMPSSMEEEWGHSLRKARLLMRCGLYIEARQTVELIYHMVEQEERNGELTQEQKDLGNSANAILEELYIIEGGQE